MNNKNNNTTGKKAKKKKVKVWKVIMLTILLIILIAAGACGGIVLAFVNTAPELSIDSFTNLAQTTKIYDKDGNYIESLHQVENRTYVPLSKVKKYTQDAFIAIEDERFREHFGIDIKRIFGALWQDIKSKSLEQGASTITQQLIKNTVLTPKKDFKRKIQEAYLAIKLERELSKDQILEYYLNTIHLGGSAYGIQAAAEYYFNKDVDQLTLAESALIAGINQSPSRYNPYLNEDTPEVYVNRGIVVLSKMLENNMISKEDFEKAKSEMQKFNINSFTKRTDNTKVKYQWFIESAIQEVKDDLKAKYKYSDDEVNQEIYSGGLKIYTTIDTKIQDIVNKVANDDKYYPKLKKDIAVWGKDKIIQPQIGVVIDDYLTGEVRAVLGGRGEQPLMSQNRATDIARQPGSSMKPLAVYGPAFDMGYAPATVIDDSPFTPEAAAAAGWKGEGPQNFNKKYDGFCTLRYAIKQSKNVVAAKLILKISPSKSIEYLKKFGLQHLVTTPDENGNTDVVPAIALGGMTNGVTPMEMAAAYGSFGNKGVYTQPILYTKVLDSEGNVLLEKNPEKHKVISPQAAYLMIDTLKGVINGGTGSKANMGSIPAAGKTGTTNESADAYFAGLTAYYSGAIWMGHDKPSEKLSLTSGETAQMWGDIMKEIHKNLPIKDFERPSGLVTATVCKDSGELPTELCSQDPRGSRLITDLFIQGTVPTEKCTTHVKATINMLTGKLATEFTPLPLLREKVFIKKPYPVDSRVADYKYQLPTESDSSDNIWDNFKPGDEGGFNFIDPSYGVTP